MQFALANCDSIDANVMNSDVQTGVKSAGLRRRTKIKSELYEYFENFTEGITYIPWSFLHATDDLWKCFGKCVTRGFVPENVRKAILYLEI